MSKKRLLSKPSGETHTSKAAAEEPVLKRFSLKTYKDLIGELWRIIDNGKPELSEQKMYNYFSEQKVITERK